MPVIMPDLSRCRKKIQKDCSVQRHQLAAVAFLKSGNVLAMDTNRSLPGDDDRFSLHAEEFVVDKLHKIKARERYGDIHMLVSRLSGSGWNMAKPCENCERVMRDYGIANIYYTDEGGKIRRLI